jgi:L-lactate dehydrogenase complex protein LldG
LSASRDRILARLRANRPLAVDAPVRYAKPLGIGPAQRVETFVERMQAVRGEVVRLSADAWVDWLIDELPRRGLRRALVGRGPIAGRFTDGGAAQVFELVPYDRPADDWKDGLFGAVDFALTGARAGLAESGSLVLWPDADEPRLMSLVPPVHVAVLAASSLHDNFADLLAREDWAAGMPANALLISGPSKTADIEQTLAFGIHGPKQLITLLLD